MLLRRWLRGFVLPVLEYCSAVWCSAADTYLKLLDHELSGASFLTGGVFECDLAHRRYMSVLCMQYKTRCNPMHPLYGALPQPYAPLLVNQLHEPFLYKEVYVIVYIPFKEREEAITHVDA